MRAMTIIMLFAILSIADASADVLYCYEEQNIGFQRRTSMKSGTFTAGKFTIKVDFSNHTIYSQKFGFGGTFEGVSSDFSKC